MMATPGPEPTGRCECLKASGEAAAVFGAETSMVRVRANTRKLSSLRTLSGHRRDGEAEALSLGDLFTADAEAVA
jgi:hypothetical protein